MVDLKAGDTVYYLLPRAPKQGRLTDVYLEAVVVNIGKMVRIKPKSCKHGRNTTPQKLLRQAPDGAVVR